MIIIRQNNYSLRDIAKDIFRGAVKELGKRYDSKTDSSGSENNILGILPIDRFIDKGRYIGKSCKFKINHKNEVEGNWDGGNIFWDLSEEFEPLENCPSVWKEFTVSGICKDGETMKARVIQKNGRILEGNILIEIR